jgi:hypothetical protein
MAELAEEARHQLLTSGSRWRTLRARGREWRDTALSSQAWQARLDRKRAEGQNFSLISVQAASPRPEELDDQWQIWIADPWRRAIFMAGQSEVDVVIHNSTWWSNGNGTSRTNGGAVNYGHGQGPGQHLVETSDYPALIEIADVSVGERLGRETLDAKVTVRREFERRRGRGVHGLVIGDAEEIHLVIDRERGIILHAGSWFGGSLYRVIEVNDVDFDSPIARESFDLAPLPGLKWIDVSGPITA